LIAVLINFGCKKEEPPTIPAVTTNAVTDLTGSTATCGGNVTSDGKSAIITRGVCWSTSARPTIKNDSKTVGGSGTGPFTISIDGLTGGTAYWVRAYATNSVGIAYGKDITFTTLGQAPTATTDSATYIFETTAKLNGTVNANGLSAAVIFEYGTTTSYGSTVTASQSPLTSDYATSVDADISGLTAGTSYHFRVIAVNNLGTVYGDDITFTTLSGAHPPVVSTTSATNISTTGATLNGAVNASGLSTTVTFEYDSIATSYGNTVAAFPNPVTGDSITNVSANISSLTPGVTYYFRVKAENSDGVCYGNDFQFTLFKCDQGPAVTTLAATNISTNGVTLNGTVNANGLYTTITFTYQSWKHFSRWVTATVSAVPGTVEGDSTANVSASVTLVRIAEKTRQFCVSATNSCGKVTGNIMSFTLLTGQAPTATTETATNITETTVTLNGIVNANNLSTAVTFEYGTTTSYGSASTASQNPVTGNSNTNVSADIAGLIKATTYHFRVAAVNNLGTVYGDDITFTTP
jgi:hypothetical protein